MKLQLSLDELRNLINSSAPELSRLKDDNERLRVEVNNLAEDIITTRQERNSAEESLDSKQNQLHYLEIELDAHRRGAMQVQDELIDTKKELAHLKADVAQSKMLVPNQEQKDLIVAAKLELMKQIIGHNPSCLPKIVGIKFLRQITGGSLKECKELFEDTLDQAHRDAQKKANNSSYIGG